MNALQWMDRYWKEYCNKIYQCITSQSKAGQNTQWRSTQRAGRNCCLLWPCQPLLVLSDAFTYLSRDHFVSFLKFVSRSSYLTTTITPALLTKRLHPLKELFESGIKCTSSWRTIVLLIARDPDISDISTRINFDSTLGIWIADRSTIQTQKGKK